MDDTSNKKSERILGRHLARELTFNELDHVSGGLVAGGGHTFSVADPPDGPHCDDNSHIATLTAASSESR